MQGFHRGVHHSVPEQTYGAAEAGADHQNRVGRDVVEEPRGGSGRQPRQNALPGLRRITSCSWSCFYLCRLILSLIKQGNVDAQTYGQILFTFFVVQYFIRSLDTCFI